MLKKLSFIVMVTMSTNAWSQMIPMQPYQPSQPQTNVYIPMQPTQPIQPAQAPTYGQESGMDYIQQQQMINEAAEQQSKSSYQPYRRYGN